MFSSSNKYINTATGNHTCIVQEPSIILRVIYIYIYIYNLCKEIVYLEYTNHAKQMLSNLIIYAASDYSISLVWTALSDTCQNTDPFQRPSVRFIINHEKDLRWILCISSRLIDPFHRPSVKIIKLYNELRILTRSKTVSQFQIFLS